MVLALLCSNRTFMELKSNRLGYASMGERAF